MDDPLWDAFRARQAEVVTDAMLYGQAGNLNEAMYFCGRDAERARNFDAHWRMLPAGAQRDIAKHCRDFHVKKFLKR